MQSHARLKHGVRAMFFRVRNEWSPPDPNRGHSALQIAARRRQLKSELRAALYFYDSSKFIVSAITGIVEVGEPVVVLATESDANLGRAICDKLLEHGHHPAPQSLRDQKLGDWGAFRASGAESGKQFENNSVFVHVRTINQVIAFEARPRVTLEQNLFVGTTLSASHVELGAGLRKAIGAVGVMRAAGLL